MQNHAADRADDVDPQLQQPVPQPRHLAAGTRSTRRPQSQFLHEHVGRGGQEDAQLVRREQTAARAVDLQPIEQFLDPILDVPASTVDLLIDEARGGYGSPPPQRERPTLPGGGVQQEVRGTGELAELGGRNENADVPAVLSRHGTIVDILNRLKSHSPRQSVRMGYRLR